MIKKVFRLLIIAAGIGIVFLGLVAYSFLTFECSFDEKFARDRVFLHLAKKGLSQENLVLDSADSEVCFYTYTYRDENQHITFRVIDDYLHGAEVGWWNHNERGQ